MAGESEIAAVGKIGENALRVLLEILRFLRENSQTKGRQNGKGALKNESELGAGKVSQKALMSYAREKNQAIVAQDGIAKNDMNAIAKKAKEYGIPVAFTGKKSKNNIKVSFRESDKEIFKQIIDDILKEKLAEKPDDHTSFKIRKENVEIFRDFLNKNDLPGNFVQDQNGGYHCIYAAADKKAFEIVISDFQKRIKEISDNLKIENQDEYIVLRHGDKVVSFSKDNIPVKAEFTAKLKSEFGFDEINASLAANKFSDTLKDNAALKHKFLDDNPLNLVNDFERHIKLKDENILVRNFDFYRVNLKENGVDCFIIMNSDGAGATLIPEMMTYAQMREMIAKRLGVSDKDTIAALLDKVDRVSNIYKRDIKNQNHGDFSIRKSGNRVSFDVVKGDKKGTYSLNDNKGAVENLIRDFGIDKKDAKEIFRKANKQRYNSKESDIVREKETPKSNKNEDFNLKISYPFTIESDKKTKSYSVAADKKIETLSKIQTDFEIGETAAEKIFNAAQKQNTFEVERVTSKTFTVKRGDKIESYPLDHSEEALSKLCGDFNIDKLCAEIIADRAAYEDVKLKVERQIGGTFTVELDGKIETYPLDHSEETLSKLRDDFGIDDETAEEIIGVAEEQSAVDNEFSKQPEQAQEKATETAKQTEFGNDPYAGWTPSDSDAPPTDEEYYQHMMGR